MSMAADYQLFLSVPRGISTGVIAQFGSQLHDVACCSEWYNVVHIADCDLSYIRLLLCNA